MGFVVIFNARNVTGHPRPSPDVFSAFYSKSVNDNDVALSRTDGKLILRYCRFDLDWLLLFSTQSSLPSYQELMFDPSGRKTLFLLFSCKFCLA
jgi:hypothetical protein